MNTFHKHEVDSLKTELNVCQRKLESKAEALLILTRDLGQCRQERDQFKLMAEQVQHRYQALKRQLAGVGPRPSVSEMDTETCGMKQHNLQSLIYELQETNKSLQFEVDDLKQKHKDAQGDIKLLREQIARQRVGTTDEGMTTRHFPAHEREDLVKQLETAREQVEQLERDLQQVFDDKEEQETERDIYKNKYERLNQELNYILKGDENRILDIDALSMENKYLHDRLKQMEEEKTMAMATVTKYKSILERKKNKGILKLGQSRSGGVVISQKQVQQLLEEGGSPTPQLLADLQSLSSALLESVNDKNLALSHQRKTNKILGQRVAELEKKLKTLEVSGLWNMSGGVSPGGSMEGSLDKLRLECDEIKSLHASAADHDDDLDLLPTKEEAGDHIPYRSTHLSSISSTADDDLPPHEPAPRDHPLLSSMDPAIDELKQDMLVKLEKSEKSPTKSVIGAGGDKAFPTSSLSPKPKAEDDLKPSSIEVPEIHEINDPKLPHIQLGNDLLQPHATDLDTINESGKGDLAHQDESDHDHNEEVFNDDLQNHDHSEEEPENDEGSEDEDEETALKKVDLTDLTPSLDFRDEDGEEEDVDKLEKLVDSAAAGLVGRQHSSGESEDDDDDDDEEEEEQDLLQNDQPVEVTA